MIDAPPTNTSPPGEPQRVFMGWHVVPSMWAIGQPKRRIKQQATRDFNAQLVGCSPWTVYRMISRVVPHIQSEYLRRCIAECQQCAGLLVLRDPSQPIPASSANVIDFFFGRDKGEALVYEWQPFEKIFRMMDRDWLIARRV